MKIITIRPTSTCTTEIFSRPAYNGVWRYESPAGDMYFVRHHSGNIAGIWEHHDGSGYIALAFAPGQYQFGLDTENEDSLNYATVACDDAQGRAFYELCQNLERLDDSVFECMRYIPLGGGPENYTRKVLYRRMTAEFPERTIFVDDEMRCWVGLACTEFGSVCTMDDFNAVRTAMFHFGMTDLCLGAPAVLRDEHTVWLGGFHA